ncbi:Serine/threonine-protein kinase B [compost metagenome]
MEALLEGADLSEAHIHESVFHRARCKGASFRGASLHDADFSYAELVDADLRDAQFLRTRVHRTVEDGARYSRRKGLIESDPELHKAQTWSKVQ